MKRNVLPRGRLAQWLLAMVTAAALAGCGGSGSSGSVPADGGTAQQECNVDDPGTFAECGEVFLGLTDADGDFVTYTVDVLSIKLSKANGAEVETLPLSTRVDFAQYTDLTEFLTAATVPPGVYVSGSIRLDYSNADVQVESNGAAVTAQIVDDTGSPIGETELDIVLDNRNRLVVTRGRPSLLTVDFDLAASHEVDLSQSPAIVTAEPFIVAEIDPVDSKDIRLRGPLVSVNQAQSTYTVDVRPFHHRNGGYGEVEVGTDADTQFEIDGVPYQGADGLDALEALGAGAPTVAFGTLLVSDRDFHADTVLAGTSVPWDGVDAVRGNIIARSGDLLTVRGATVMSGSGTVVFNDNVQVSVGPDTRITKITDRDAILDSGDLSVGQRIVAFGELSGAPSTDPLTLDATQGKVQMHLTRVSGTASTVLPGQLNMDVQHIDRRRISLFDFSGTGMTPDVDADPMDYEIATGNLSMDAIASGTPVRAFGFVSPFGEAPPDFDGRTLVDLTMRGARLGVGWTENGTTAPFLSIGEDGLVLDLDNLDIGTRHHILLGGVLIDLFGLPGSPSIVPAGDGRTRFAIKEPGKVTIYSDFNDFVADLETKLDGATLARSFHAFGGYDQAANTLTARIMGIHLK